MLNEIKYFIQRGRRGYSDQDIWSFDNYLCEIIPPALRSLKEKGIGCPGELWDEKNNNNECHKWHEILEEIAQGFEAGGEIGSPRLNLVKKEGSDFYESKIDRGREKQLSKKFDRGMELFSKYFLNLWD